jgi:hypothetical protein
MNNAFELEALLKVIPVHDEINESSTEAGESQTSEAGQVEEVDSRGFEIITE